MDRDLQRLQQLVTMLKDNNVAYFKDSEVELIFATQVESPFVKQTLDNFRDKQPEVVEEPEEPAEERLLPDTYYEPSLWGDGKVPDFLKR